MTAIPTPMRGLTWDQWEVGSNFRTATRTVTEADLVNFVALFGFNEPLFLDAEVSAARGHSGRLVPGALTYCVAEGLVLQTNVMFETGLAFLAMQLDVHRPVIVGDTLYAVVEVLGTRATASGGNGVVTTSVQVCNQRDEPVLTYSPVRLIRGPGSDPC